MYEPNNKNRRKHFYYDEAYHDLSITQDNGIQNINKNDASTYFVVSLVGVDEEEINNFLGFYSKIEEKYKKIIGIKQVDEFKGTTIKIKNYDNGLSSMKNDYLKFYTELFEMLYKFSAIVQISTISKFEYVIHEIFKEIYNACPIPREIYKPFLYGLIKFVDKHKTDRLIVLMHSGDCDSEKIVQEIRSIIENVRNSSSKFKLKKSEMEFADVLNVVLSCISGNLNTKKKYEWNYSYSLEGFSKLIEELKLTDYDISLDLDGKGHRTEKIYDTAKKMFPNALIDRYESKDNIGIRISDFISNLIGRFIKVVDLECTNKQKEIEKKGTFNEQILLNDQWFDINEDAFNCYKSIGKFFNSKSDIYWTTQIGIYGDIPIVVYRLFQYFYEQKSYGDFKKISSHTHAVTLDSEVVEKLKSIYGE